MNSATNIQSIKKKQLKKNLSQNLIPLHQVLIEKATEARADQINVFC